MHYPCLCSKKPQVKGLLNLTFSISTNQTDTNPPSACVTPPCGCVLQGKLTVDSGRAETAALMAQGELALDLDPAMLKSSPSTSPGASPGAAAGSTDVVDSSSDAAAAATMSPQCVHIVVSAVEAWGEADVHVKVHYLPSHLITRKQQTYPLHFTSSHIPSLYDTHIL